MAVTDAATEPEPEQSQAPTHGGTHGGTHAEPRPEPQAEAPPAEQLSRLVRRQRLFLVATSATAVLALGGLVAAQWVKSPAQLAADHGPPKGSVLTAQVTSRVLSQTVVVRGNVVPGGRIQVTPAAAQGAAALVVTATPLHAGQPIHPGDVLVQVSGRPVIALPGTTPAYRDLKPGDTGNDVSELQHALASLGYQDGDPDGHFGAGTKDALTRLYAHLGYDPATTGGPGDTGDQQALHAADQAVTVADRAVTAARQQLRTAQHAKPLIQSAVDTARQNLQYAQQDLGTATTQRDQLVATTGVDLPMAEFVFVPSFPASLAAVNGSVGSTVSGTLLSLDTGRLVIDSVVQEGDHELLKPGMKVQIHSEALNADATGTVGTIGPYSAGAAAAGSSGGSGGAGGSGGGAGSGGGDSGSGAQAGSAGGSGTQSTPGYPVTVTLDSALDNRWLGQDVRLTVTAASTPHPVLVVPAAAVVTDATGTTTVAVLGAGGTQRRVAVRAGVDAAGFVEVTPVQADALNAGDQVVIGT